MTFDESRVCLGERAEIDPQVLLGYQYPGWNKPTIIGDDAVIRSGTVIYTNTQIGQRFTCGHHVTVRANTTIGDDVVLLHQVTLEGNLVIGSGVKIMAHTYLSSTTHIGDLVFIGPGTIFLNDKYPMRQQKSVQGARVDNSVTIGGGVTVCPNITIGQGAFIGAGTVVYKSVPPHTLAFGSPMQFRPIPADLPQENIAELLLNSSDLWGRQRGG